MKTYAHIKPCIWMLIFNSVIHNTPPKWKYHNCSSPGEWKVKCAISIHWNTATIKKKTLLTHPVSWTQNHYAKWNKSDIQDYFCTIPFMWNVQKKQITRDRKQASGCYRLQVETGSDYNWHEGSFWDDGCTTL